MPPRESAITGRRPTRSDRRGQRKRAPKVPSGYADDSEPNEAPICNSKCSRSATLTGKVSVKPRRLRKVERRTEATETFDAVLSRRSRPTEAGGGGGVGDGALPAAAVSCVAVRAPEQPNMLVNEDLEHCIKN